MAHLRRVQVKEGVTSPIKLPAKSHAFAELLIFVNEDSVNLYKVLTTGLGTSQALRVFFVLVFEKCMEYPRFCGCQCAAYFCTNSFNIGLFQTLHILPDAVIYGIMP